MKTSRAAVVALAIAAPIVLASILAGCDQGSPAVPSAPPVVAPTVVICPKVDPSFESIRTTFFQTDTCGSGRSNCHAPSSNGNSGGLIFDSDAAGIYDELLYLKDGGFGPNAANNSGSARGLVRVVPGDSGASFLIIKLHLQTTADPLYGSGMPRDYPGQICDQDIETIAAWIDNGAKFDEDGATPFPIADSGDESDASDASESDAGDAAD
jgi:hypothetical protein